MIDAAAFRPVPAIELDQLVYRWPGQVEACLDIAALSVAAGERVFLHGPSGSGKSTLLGLLGGVNVAQSGRVSVLGRELKAIGARERDRMRAAHIGFLFQQFNLLPWLSAIDNVLLPATFSAERKLRATSERPLRDEAARLLTQLDLVPSLWGKNAAELSVGQQQRVAAARALIGRPPIVIADEPTSALDAARQLAFVDLLLRECGAARATLIFVSHDDRLAVHFDRQLSLAEINRATNSAELAGRAP